MREIKFRAWSNGSYWPLRCIDYLGDGRIYNIRLAIQVDEDDWDFPSVDPNDVILEQYTGLKDKNGKEIYEGDIVSRNTPYARSGAIQFAQGIFGINWDYGQNPDPLWIEGSMYGSWCGKHNLRPVDDGFMSETMEVIGNIHENPELLNA